jgi:hypothetical protein
MPKQSCSIERLTIFEVNIMIAKCARFAVLFLFLSVLADSAAAQTTELTYQGQLNSSSIPANGSFDFEFALFDSAGAQIGPVLTRSGVAVTNGIFSANLDFGSSFPGATRFLEIRVKQSGGGAFTTLSPRQPVTSAPYSVRSINSENAVNATTATNALSLGGVAANQYLQSNGDGSGLTNLNARSVTSGTLANARLGQIPTANIADSAVTAVKIAPGQVVKSINGLKDNVTLAAGANVSITPSGNTLTIASTAGISGTGTTNTVPLWTSATGLGNSVITQSAQGRIGVGTANPSGRLEVIDIQGGQAAISARGTTTGTGLYAESQGSGFGITGFSLTGSGVHGTSSSGTGLEGSGRIGTRSYGSSIALTTSTGSGTGGIAVKATGSSWFSGDTTPLSVSNTGIGTGVVIGSAGNFGYISAFDYGVFQARTLLLNNSGGLVGIGTNTPTHTLSVNGSAAKPGGGSWDNFSDERLKNLKGRFNGGLKAVMKLQPLRYEYKSDNAVGVKSDGGISGSAPRRSRR